MEHNTFIEKPSACGRRETGLLHTLARKMALVVATLYVLAAACGRVDAQPVYSNSRDYFRDSHYHDIYSLGQGRLHFKTLLYAEGLANSCYANYGDDPYSPFVAFSNSIAWFSANGVDVPFMDYYTDTLIGVAPTTVGDELRLGIQQR